VKPTELLALLQECYRERNALLLRHVAVARHVGDLDINNTYQYVIAREETQLSWLQAAIEELGGVASPGGAEPGIEASKSKDFVLSLLRDDAASAAAFVTAWKDRVESVTNARHRGMLRVILGETLEHQRFFEQAVGGRDDLLGRRLDAGARRGAVMANRWLGN
jgi:hypothetical protein